MLRAGNAAFSTGNTEVYSATMSDLTRGIKSIKGTGQGPLQE